MTPAPLFQAIKPQKHKDAGEALIFFSSAVIATAIIFDQGRAEEDSSARWHPGIHIYIYIHEGSAAPQLFTDVSDLKPL